MGISVLYIRGTHHYLPWVTSAPRVCLEHEKKITNNFCDKLFHTPQKRGLNFFGVAISCAPLDFSSVCVTQIINIREQHGRY